MNPCFAIIDRNTLESTALKDILWELFNHVELHMYNSIDSFIRDSNRHFVHFFVSSELLFSDSDEFDTLKHMTTVLTDGKNPNIDQSGYRTLDITASEEEIVTRLMDLQKMGHYGEMTATVKEMSGSKKNRLSDREKDVLRLMVKGLINKEIAKELNISTTTVIFHRNNICDKLQTRSIGKLTIYAVLSGIVSIKEI
ncbi:MAG: helix-turn-helix transcriptional regulator [Bacteroidales bacterium]|nr:helix-turn-helix transcriptional regulator [Bacteroidales bacterium]